MQSMSSSDKIELTKESYEAALEVKTILQRFAKRNDFLLDQTSQYAIKLKEQIRERFPSYDSNISFCEGALYLQKHFSASLLDMAAKQPGNGGYSCHHCNLDLKCMEIDLKGIIKLNSVDWRTLAACHIQAHFSFNNFVAWYMCRFCHDWGVEPPQIFVSPVAMLQHLRNHPKNDITGARTNQILMAELP